MVVFIHSRVRCRSRAGYCRRRVGLHLTAINTILLAPCDTLRAPERAKAAALFRVMACSRHVALSRPRGHSRLLHFHSEFVHLAVELLGLEAEYVLAVQLLRHA